MAAVAAAVAKLLCANVLPARFALIAMLKSTVQEFASTVIDTFKVVRTGKAAAAALRVIEISSRLRVIYNTRRSTVIRESAVLRHTRRNRKRSVGRQGR